MLVWAHRKALNDITPWIEPARTRRPGHGHIALVHHPRNTSAEALGRTLNAVIGGQGALDTTTTGNLARAM
ncbi:hypothetical protein ACRAWD_10790 [Caulobacter segnis]